MALNRPITHIDCFAGSGGRIYNLDMDFNIIKNHAILAFNVWSTQRQ